MLNFFVRRPITTLMFVLFWVILGIYSLPKMNIELTPSLDFPYVTATFVYPGASPSEIESQVVKKAEDAMSEVAGIKKITSQVFENGAFVMAEFNLGVDVNDKSAEVKTKIDALASEFPDDLKQPVVEKLDPLQQSVVDIALVGGDARELQEYIDKTLSNRITAINGVAKVNSFGGRDRAILIEMNPEQMAAHGVTVTDVVGALGARNLNVPGGKIETTKTSSGVRFIGEFASVDEIANLSLTTAEGQQFKLSDIATVTDAAREVETGARHNGMDVVIASVVKASDGNAIKISGDIKKKLPELESELQARFPDVQMQIVNDTSTTILNETWETAWGIVLGIIFTILILLAFTQNWRSTIIAGVVIPASLVAGFFFMNNSGFTVNMMTLLAYSSALGTLVSNAIILIESALQEMRTGASPNDAAVTGTKKVAVSVLAGVGTNVVVFLPLAFMGGIVGKFMAQFGMTVVYLTLLSLMFSFTLTPMMIAQFLRLSTKNKKQKSQVFMQKEDKKSSVGTPSHLRRWYDYQFAYPGRVILIAVAALIGSGFFMNFVGNEFSSSFDSSEINLTVRVPMGATYEKSLSIAQEIESRAKEFEDIIATTVKIGDQGLQNISVNAKIKDASHRSMSDRNLSRALLKRLSDIPDAEIQIKPGMAMNGDLSDLVLDIHGDDEAQREMYVSDILEKINQIPEVQSAVRAQQKPGTEIQFIPDDEKMNFWGIKNAYAGTALRTALYGNDEYKYKENGEEYPIVLEFAQPFQTTEMFDNVYVNSQKGMVPLSELGTVQETTATPDIRRLDKRRITEINIIIGRSTMGPVQKKIQTVLDNVDWQPGYGATFGGMSEIQGETTGEIGRAFLLATILTYMLLAAILNALGHPLTIAISILTSFAGVFVMLFLSGASMNVGAMLASVMLVGLVVNNNILVLEPTINRIRHGEKPCDALWTELMNKKLMVVMTSLAIIAGMVPQLWGGSGTKVAMAAVMIGGMAASLFWTYTLMPALFFVIENLRNRHGKK